jgi:anti-sigma B factor antagonist
MHIHVHAALENSPRASSGISAAGFHLGHAGRYVIFAIDGPLTQSWAAEELRAEVTAMLEGGRRDLILDLADVPYADSAGIGALVAAYTLIQGAGGKLVLLSVPGRVREMLKRLHLDRVFTFSDDPTLAFAKS